MVLWFEGRMGVSLRKSYPGVAMMQSRLYCG
jgi:hypothetical protein